MKKNKQPKKYDDVEQVEILTYPIALTTPTELCISILDDEIHKLEEELEEFKRVRDLLIDDARKRQGVKKI